MHNHHHGPCGYRPSQHPLHVGELKYSAEQINELLDMIPKKAGREELIDKETKKEITSHLGNTDIHVSKEDKDRWDLGIGGTTFIADEEDITLAQGEKGKVYKLKDRDTSKGKGYIILRTDRSLAEQMVQENTIYEVRYDFDLGGATLEIPSNCILDFKGGSFNNGSITCADGIIINSNSKIFEKITLTKDSKFANDEINPAWFGVIGDGVADDTGAIQYMLSFCKNIYRKKINVRNAVDSSPRIRFGSSGNNVKITTPITIDFLCNILGSPTFLYDGAEIEDGGVIIIDKQYNTTFEFSVAKYYSTDVVDLSSGIKFAGVKTIDCVWCTFNIHQIYGFYRGVYMVCDGYGTWQCTFNVHYVSFCIDAFVCNTINSGWSNGNIVRDTIFLGQTGDIILADGQKEGAFLRFIGDGSYGANSWIIDNIQCESKINKTLAIRFIHIQLDEPNLFQDFSIQNIRLEEIGYYMMLSNCEHRRWTISHILYRTAYNIYLTKYNLDVQYNNRILSGYGINILGASGGNVHTRIYEDAVNEHYYCGRYYNLSTKSKLVGLQRVEAEVDSLSNFARPSEVYKLSPGQSIMIKKTGSGRFYIVFFNTEGTRIDCPPDDILFDETSLYTVSNEGYKVYLQNLTDSTNTGWINNKSSSTVYRIAILYNNDYELVSNKDITIVPNNPTYKKRGTTEERPTISYKGAGYEYFDTTIGSKLIYNGSSWVDTTPISEDGYKYYYNFDEAKNATFEPLINAYVRNNKVFAITGVQKDVLYTASCDRFGAPAKRYVISAGQTIKIRKWNSSLRIYIVCFSADNNHTTIPSEITYDTTRLSKVTSGSVDYLQTTNDGYNIIEITNSGETDIIFSIICCADYYIYSDKIINNIEIINWLKKKGTTEERPSANASIAGWQYYDTTLNKVVMYNGTAWVNLDGSTLS